MTTERSRHDPLLTLRQLAELEGLKYEQVRWMVRNGAPHYRAGGIKVRLSEWCAWLSTRKQGGDDGASR